MTQAIPSETRPEPRAEAELDYRQRQLVANDVLCNRIVGIAGLVICLSLLIVARSLSPADKGYGTHEALGLQPCGFKTVTGIPCMTCGMTTAFSHTTRGQFVSAFIVQPAGTLLALITAMLTFVFGWAAIQGMSLKPLGSFIARPRVLFSLFGFMLVSWIFEIVRHLQH